MKVPAPTCGGTLQHSLRNRHYCSSHHAGQSVSRGCWHQEFIKIDHQHPHIATPEGQDCVIFHNLQGTKQGRGGVVAFRNVHGYA